MNTTTKTLIILTGMMIFIAGNHANGQILQYGLKAGAQLTWMKSDDKGFRDQVAIHPLWGIMGALYFHSK